MQIQEIIQNTRSTLELEPHETLDGPEVLQEGYDSMLWTLWLCILSHTLSQKPPEITSNNNLPVLQWISKIQTKYPVHTNPPRSFSGEQQDLQMLKEILSSTQMTENNICDRISWASYVLTEISLEAPRIWRLEKGDGIVEVNVVQKVLCVRMD